MRFRLFNVDFIIEYSFFLMLSFAVILGANDLSDLLLYSSLHELSHIIMLISFGGRPDSVRLSYYGLALKYSDCLPVFKEICVLLAGPLANLILYFITKKEINFLLFVLNFLPIYPIDMGRAIRLISLRASKILSLVTLILLIALSIYVLICYKSFSLIFITCYLFVYSINY